MISGSPVAAAPRISGRSTISPEAIFSSGDPDLGQQRHGLVVERGREEVDAPRARVIGELGVPLARERDVLQQLGRRHCRPLPQKLALGLARVDAVARVGLELDGVGAGLGGDVDQLLGDGEIPVVVRACLRDHVAWAPSRRSAALRPRNWGGKLTPQPCATTRRHRRQDPARSASGPTRSTNERIVARSSSVSRLSLIVRTGGSRRRARWGKRSGRSRTNGVTCSRSYGSRASAAACSSAARETTSTSSPSGKLRGSRVFQA